MNYIFTFIVYHMWHLNSNNRVKNIFLTFDGFRLRIPNTIHYYRHINKVLKLEILNQRRTVSDIRIIQSFLLIDRIDEPCLFQ